MGFSTDLVNLEFNLASSAFSGCLLSNSFLAAAVRDPPPAPRPGSDCTRRVCSQVMSSGVDTMVPGMFFIKGVSAAR